MLKTAFNNIMKIAALLGVIIPFVIFLSTRKVKELTFKNVALTELVSDDKITDDAIKVFFEEERIYNLYSLSCLIRNTGNVPITADDLVYSITISFPNAVRVLKYSFFPIPHNIQIKGPFLNGKDFEILPDLLNPNDIIDISFYITSKNADNMSPSLTNRILGGEIVNLNINEEVKSKVKFSNRLFYSLEGIIFWIAFVYSFLYLAFMGYLVYYGEIEGVKKPFSKLLLFLSITIGLYCNILYLVQTKF